MASTTLLIVNLVVTIAIILVMILRFKQNPVISMFVGALYMGIASKLGLVETVNSTVAGFGSTMQGIGISVGYGDRPRFRGAIRDGLHWRGGHRGGGGLILGVLVGKKPADGDGCNQQQHHQDADDYGPRPVALARAVRSAVRGISWILVAHVLLSLLPVDIPSIVTWITRHLWGLQDKFP